MCNNFFTINLDLNLTLADELPDALQMVGNILDHTGIDDLIINATRDAAIAVVEGWVVIKYFTQLLRIIHYSP